MFTNTVNQRALVYTLPPGFALTWLKADGTTGQQMFSAGHVETRCPSDGWILSFMRIGTANASVRVTPEDVETLPNGQLTIRALLGDKMSFLDAEAAALAYIRKDVPPGATDVTVVAVADLPTQRFRMAWRKSPRLAIDMPLARGQRMNEVRVTRTPRLEKSDVDVVRAQEEANVVMQNNLKTYRQALRDLPATEQPNVDAITTPESLAAWEPAWPTDPTI